MGLSIHTNFASLTTQNQLNNTNKMLGTAMQRLGTGLRINSAADDAAGLQMATRLQAQSNGQKVGMRNAHRSAHERPGHPGRQRHRERGRPSGHGHRNEGTDRRAEEHQR